MKGRSKIMKNGTLDMTEGSAVRHILVFSVPTLIGNIFQQIYNLADSVIVGRFVGSGALAAVGATSSITFLFFALCNGVGSGGGIIASQHFGAKDDVQVRRCIVNTGVIMVVIPVIFGLLGFALAPAFLRILGTPADIVADAVSYTRILCLGLLFVSIYNYLSAMLRALGDSRSPLYFLIVASVINIILDVVLVYFFKMGINGAAYATVFAQLIAAISCGVFAVVTNPYFKLTKEDFVITARMTGSILRLGVPLSLQFGLIAISSMAVQRIVNSFGTVAVAAFTATSRIEQLIHQPYTTLGVSLSTYCGQNYGASKYDRVYDGYRKCLIMMAVLTVFMVALMQIFGGTITSLFVSDPEVVELGAVGLKISSLFYIALGLIYVVRGILNGVGDAFFALFNGIVEIIGRFTVPLIMTKYMGFGRLGIWWSCGVVWVISGVTAWLRYYTHLHHKITKATGDRK